MKGKESFHWCDHCKENSVRIKCYDGENGKRKRVMFCINKGCGYVQNIPFPEECVNV